MEASELTNGGPKYRAGYRPSSDDLCYVFLLEEDLNRTVRRRGRPDGAPLRSAARGTAASGARSATASPIDASQPPVDRGDLRRGAVVPWPIIIIGDAAHACLRRYRAGCAMCAEDAVVLAETLAGGEHDQVAAEVHERRSRA